jgi:hypothetical protein
MEFTKKTISRELRFSIPIPWNEELFHKIGLSGYSEQIKVVPRNGNSCSVRCAGYTLSTPMCIFIPKCQLFPFLAERITGSRFSSAFFVEFGASMKEPSTIVPLLKRRPLAVSYFLNNSKTCLSRPFFSRRCRKRRIVVSSGHFESIVRPTKRRHAKES